VTWRPARPAVVLLALAACGAPDPCETSFARRIRRSSLPYAGEWVVARGDTLTLPEGMGERFKLRAFRLDTVAAAVEETCRFRGVLVFAAPRAETLAVTWFGEPERAYIFGWPADVGPFAGIGLSWWGRDSLRGAVLFDEQLGVRVPAGVTAQVYAGRRE
jgi:hypothetical protein